MILPLKHIEIKEINEMLEHFIFVKSMYSTLSLTKQDRKFLSKINVKITILKLMT